MEATPILQVLKYHEETKHHSHRYARAMRALDWATQPAPFRSYAGAAPVLLPLLHQDPEGEHLDLYERTRNTFWDFNLKSIGAFLELSLGLSAWKALPDSTSRWALRMNPSSGNLHPTEAHLLLPAMDGALRYQSVAGTSVAPGLYHYNAYSHALEPRARWPSGYGERVRSHFQSPGFLIGLSHIAWREAWKYGERALRYCHHDTGHALAALSLAGNLLGWKVTALTSLSTADAETVLGFPAVTWPLEEEERADLLLFVSPAGHRAIGRGLPQDLLDAFKRLTLEGAPSVLSPHHVEWPIIPETERAAAKPRTPEGSVSFEAPSLLEHPVSVLSGAALIRRRRSAVAMDGETTLQATQFLAMLDKTLPRNGVAPFDLEVGEPRVHLALFVHRVVGLETGLYFWVRNLAHLQDLKRSMDRFFAWEPVLGSDRLFRLKSHDYRSEAVAISCGQSIAGEGAFSAGMIAQFLPVLDREPWQYPALFWEAGMIGQVLYLEAEAHGLRGTGIGCFFDDAMHQLLGLKTNAYQSLYHFTVGGPVEDTRLQTLPPYAHLPADRR